MKLEQGLSQQLNQFQVQSLKILSFDNYELEKFLQDEYAENPLMEHKESGKEFFTLHGNAGGYQDIEQSDIEDKKIEDPEAFFMEQSLPVEQLAACGIKHFYDKDADFPKPLYLRAPDVSAPKA